MIIEYIELNWLCKHMEKVEASKQSFLYWIEWIVLNYQIFPVSVVKNHSNSYILPVSVKPSLPISVYNFCVSSTLSNYSDDMVLKKASFDSYSFKSSSFINSPSQRSFCHLKFSSPKFPTTRKSSIWVSPTSRNNFSLFDSFSH